MIQGHQHVYCAAGLGEGRFFRAITFRGMCRVLLRGPPVNGYATISNVQTFSPPCIYCVAGVGGGEVAYLYHLSLLVVSRELILSFVSWDLPSHYL